MSLPICKQVSLRTDLSQAFYCFHVWCAAGDKNTVLVGAPTADTAHCPKQNHNIFPVGDGSDVAGIVPMVAAGVQPCWHEHFACQLL